MGIVKFQGYVMRLFGAYVKCCKSAASSTGEARLPPPPLSRFGGGLAKPDSKLPYSKSLDTDLRSLRLFRSGFIPGVDQIGRLGNYGGVLFGQDSFQAESDGSDSET